MAPNMAVLGARPEDFVIVAKGAMKDACAVINPRKAAKQQMIEIYQQACDGTRLNDTSLPNLWPCGQKSGHQKFRLASHLDMAQKERTIHDENLSHQPDFEK